MAPTTADEREPDHELDVRTLRVSFAEQSRLVNRGMRSGAIRVQSRIAYLTLSNPHALATSCRVSTCGRGRR